MNKGVATACVAGGAVGVAQALVGLVFFVRHDPKRAHFLVGLFVGTTLLVAAVSLGQAGLWMAQWNLIFDLSEIDPASAIFDQSGRHMVVRDELRGSFRSLALVAAFCCFFQACLAGHLFATRRYAVGFFALTGGTKHASPTEKDAVGTETTSLLVV